MNLYIKKWFTLLIINCLAINICEEAEIITFEKLYKSGVNSYLEERWTDCIESLEGVIQNYNTYIKTLVNCRIKCKQETENSEPLFPDNIENLNFYENIIKSTLCIIKCKNKHSDLFKKFTLTKGFDKLFENRKPYEYLHICYFQKNQIQEAASAAFTYLVIHPEDEAMAKNLRYYSSLPEVDMKEIVNLEAKDHVYLYTYGSNAYEKKDWNAVISYMEESLTAYLQAEEECRAQCEGPFDQGWYPDFTASVANHFTYCLKCKRRCPGKLNNLNGEIHDDLLPSHYHFLQYAYYKVGNLQKAYECVASYLLFYPNDEVMLSNKDYYKKKSENKNATVLPRQEAIEYVQRQKYEQKLLQFIHTAFVFGNSTQIVTSKRTNHKTCRKTDNSTIFLDDRLLCGQNRFVVDGVLTEFECESFIQLAQMFAVEGDGYYGNKSPHSKMEIFKGLTVGRAALLVYFGLMDSKLLEMYLTVTEMGKQILREYFQLKSDLYFTYTHLVCRSTLPGSPLNRTDFSHIIHSDNCNLQKDMRCTREPPSYTWRDYSIIIYLNDNFDGGEFVFTEKTDSTKVQSSFKPMCGRMVGFTSGPENLHGVRAVLRGTRCAIAAWFTLNSKYEEIERILAYKLLNKIHTTDKNAQDLIFRELQKYVPIEKS